MRLWGDAIDGDFMVIVCVNDCGDVEVVAQLLVYAMLLGFTTVPGYLGEGDRVNSVFLMTAPIHTR